MTKQSHATLLKKNDVRERTKLSNSTLYNLMADGLFPCSIQVGPRSVRWVEAEVQAFIEQCIDTRDGKKVPK